MVGCPCRPVDSTGAKWELPVYPNLKTAKQGKDLKLALQRGDSSVWDNLQDNSIWLELNPELRDPTFPPAGARVQVRLFMEPSLERLAACPSATEGNAQWKPRLERTPKPRSAPAAALDVVDLEDDGNDDYEASHPHTRKRPHAEMEEGRPKKRSHAGMEEGHGIFHSTRQFKPTQRKPNPTPPHRSASGERQRANSPRNPARASRPLARPPPHPI